MLCPASADAPALTGGSTCTGIPAMGERFGAAGAGAAVRVVAGAAAAGGGGAGRDIDAASPRIAAGCSGGGVTERDGAMSVKSSIDGGSVGAGVSFSPGKGCGSVRVYAVGFSGAGPVGRPMASGGHWVD
ncbi:hypothetical protein, partial [Ramlibacter sp.]|uniref:hypothetical protein n=1 Tax=Ramlibacter sp. TaxID=1917967 RepID=UPI003D0C8F54